MSTPLSLYFLVACGIILLPQISISLKCDSIPPILWCSDDEVAEECGFLSLCQRYRNATYERNIGLTLSYESMCPLSRRFIVDQLYPIAVGNLADFVRIEMLPQGKQDNQTGAVTCRRGNMECELNKHHLCATKYLNDYPEGGSIPYIACLSGFDDQFFDLAEALNYCFQMLGISTVKMRQILKCVDGDEGASLQQEAVKKVDELDKSNKDDTPITLSVNNVSIALTNKIATNTLGAVLCPWLSPKEVPKFCDSFWVIR